MSSNHHVNKNKENYCCSTSSSKDGKKHPPAQHKDEEEEQLRQQQQSRQILHLLKRFSHPAFSGVLLHHVGRGTSSTASASASRPSDNPPIDFLHIGGGNDAGNGSGRIIVRFHVPAHLCNAQGRLTCGTLTAWIDEVSSWSFVCADDRHRPGVR